MHPLSFLSSELTDPLAENVSASRGRPKAANHRLLIEKRLKDAWGSVPRSAEMILSQLPAPTREHTRVTPEKPQSTSRALANVGTTIKEPPPYGTADRREYRPRRQEDFGDGGEFLKLIYIRQLQKIPKHLLLRCILGGFSNLLRKL